MIGNILIKEKIRSSELNTLLREFPQYKLLQLEPDVPVISLGIDDCAQVEVLYGSCLKQEELNLLPRLHWIHSPSPYLDSICLGPIRKQENILLTTTKDENLTQVGSFAISAALAYAKRLFLWEEESRRPESLDLEATREGMWRVEDCLFLQIGLGLIGTEISRRAMHEGFQVIGAQEIPSFHPHCEEVIAISDLDSLLPKADIVCLALPRDQICEPWFNRSKLEMMKDDSVLLAFGTGSVLYLEDLGEVGMTGKFRGILLDAHFSPPIPSDFPLLKRKEVIITHESSFYPMSESDQGFNTFIYNLRQYVHGNFSDMKNIL